MRVIVSLFMITLNCLITFSTSKLPYLYYYYTSSLTTTVFWVMSKFFPI